MTYVITQRLKNVGDKTHQPPTHFLDAFADTTPANGLVVIEEEQREGSDDVLDVPEAYVADMSGPYTDDAPECTCKHCGCEDDVDSCNECEGWSSAELEASCPIHGEL